MTMDGMGGMSGMGGMGLGLPALAMLQQQSDAGAQLLNGSSMLQTAPMTGAASVVPPLFQMPNLTAMLAGGNGGTMPSAASCSGGGTSSWESGASSWSKQSKGGKGSEQTGNNDWNDWKNKNYDWKSDDWKNKNNDWI